MLVWTGLTPSLPHTERIKRHRITKFLKKVWLDEVKRHLGVVDYRCRAKEATLTQYGEQPMNSEHYSFCLILNETAKMLTTMVMGPDKLLGKFKTDLSDVDTKWARKYAGTGWIEVAHPSTFYTAKNVPAGIVAQIDSFISVKVQEG